MTAAYYPRPANGPAAVCVALGVSGVAFAVVPVLGFLLGLLALPFGAVGIRRASRAAATHGWVCWFGVGMGLLAMGFWPLLLIAAELAAG